MHKRHKSEREIVDEIKEHIAVDNPHKPNFKKAYKEDKRHILKTPKVL